MRLGRAFRRPSLPTMAKTAAARDRRPLEVVLEPEGAGPVDAVGLLAALREIAAVGAVVEPDPEVGAVGLLLAVDPAGRLVVLDGGRLDEGPVLEELLPGLARRHGARVRAGAEVFAEAEEDAAELPEAVGPVVRVLALRRGPEVDRELALEVASLLEDDVVLVPAGAWTLAVPATPVSSWALPWSGRHRPVLSLVRAGERALVLSAHLSGAARSGSPSERALAHSVPGWSWSALPRRVEPLVPRAAADALEADVRRAVFDLAGDVDAAELARAVGLDAAGAGRLGDLLAEPLHPTTADALTQVLGLPDAVPGLLSGRLRAEELPGAVRGEHRKGLGLVLESLLARPEGRGPIARLRRWDHDRPVLSVLWIAAEAAVATSAVALALTDDHRLADRPWNVVTGVVGALVAVDAVGSALLLVTVRRRARSAFGPRRDDGH